MTIWQFDLLYLPYALPQFLTVIVGVLLGVVVWRSPSDRPVKRSFTAFLIATTFWSLTYGFELLSPTLEAKLVWANWEYLGIALTGSFWLMYALAYRQQDRWLRPGWVAALCLIPLATQFMIRTNDAHHLHWATVTLDRSMPIPLLMTTPGTWFWVHAGSSYVFLITGMFLFITPLIRSSSTFRGQSWSLICAALLPLVGNMLYITGIVQTGGLDPTPVLFSISGILLIASGMRFQLFNFTPTANRLVLENMQDGVFVVDHQNRFVSVNAAAEEILGQPRSAVIGKSVKDVLLGRFPEIITRYESVESLTDELEINRADGVHIYDLRITSMYGPGGSHRGRIAVLRDITEQRRVISEVQEQRNLAQALQASSEAINSSLELDPVLDKILELVESVVPYETASLFLIEDENAEVVRARSSNPADQSRASELPGLIYPIVETRTLRSMYESSQPLLIDDTLEFEGWITLNATRWVRSYVGVPVKVGDEMIGFLNLYSAHPNNYSIQDADKLQAFAVQAAIAIRNARNYMETEEQNQRLIMLSLITTIGTVNAPIEDLVRMLGEAASMMIQADTAFITRWDARNHKTVPITASGGLHDRYVTLPEPFPGQPSVTESVVRSGETIVVEDVFNTEHISPRVASRFPTRSMVGLPLFANDEAFGALLLGFNAPHVFTDDELALAEQAANLMALVITKSLSMEELQMRNRELDAFSHTVAHDLKAPLQGISGYLELIRMTGEDALPPETEGHITSAMRFTLKIGEIVDAMMLLAGLREQEYEPERVAVAPLIRAALDRFQLDITEQGINVELAEKYPDVMGHGPWIEEVFANLISNSIKYMGARKKNPTITISARRLPDRILYEVRDNGVGISADKLPTVFRLFSRFHQSLAEGTGLGMSIVQRIIARMDGEVGIESEAGKGTTVWFVLNAPPSE